MRRGPGPPGRRQQQPWAGPSLQTAIRAMVTRTESSEPVRQQLVRVSLEATHCHPGCTLCLDLGSEGPHAPLQAWPGLRIVLPPIPVLHLPSAVIGNPCAGHRDTASASLGVSPTQWLMACGTTWGKYPQIDHP